MYSVHSVNINYHYYYCYYYIPWITLRQTELAFSAGNTPSSSLCLALPEIHFLFLSSLILVCSISSHPSGCNSVKAAQCPLRALTVTRIPVSELANCTTIVRESSAQPHPPTTRGLTPELELCLLFCNLRTQPQAQHTVGA